MHVPNDIRRMDGISEVFSRETLKKKARKIHIYDEMQAYFMGTGAFCGRKKLCGIQRNYEHSPDARAFSDHVASYPAAMR